MFDSLMLSDLPDRSRRVLRERSSTRPVLWVVEENGLEAVVKDFSRNGFLYRHTLGRFLVWREEKAYRRLRGLRGIPALYRVISGQALVIARIRGKSLEGLEREKKLPRAFFEELETLVASAHARGIAHCDLKRAPNILLGDDGRPYVVDWSASVSASELPLFPLDRIYRRFLLDDFNAITKIQLRHCPDEVSEERIRRYQHRGVAELLVRSLRDRLRDLLKRLV
jgi:predicted Ser/Thr protein kinase